MEQRLFKLIPENEGRLPWFIRNMHAGDRVQPFMKGWKAERYYKAWMVLWIGGSADELIAAYRAKFNASGKDAKANMQRTFAAIEECRAAVQLTSVCKLQTNQLEDVLNKMLSKKASAVVAAMHASASLAQSEWQTAVRAARRT
jgi:hypothetical protein